MVERHADFFKKQQIRFTWPEKSIEEEHKSKRYEEFISSIKANWGNSEDEFIKRLLIFFHESPDSQFTVEVSQYGPLGFYNLERRTITINLNTHLNPLDTIKHELVHLMLERFIRAYNFSHEQKEDLVNTILSLIKSEPSKPSIS